MQPLGADAKYTIEHVGIQHPVAIAAVCDASRLNQRYFRCVTRHRIQVVCRQDYRFSCLREAAAQIQDFKAMLNVEARRRLVEQDDLRLNRKAAGDRNPLALPSRESGHESSAKMPDIATGNSVVDRASILGRCPLKSAAPRMTPHGDHFFHGECKIHSTFLRNERDALSQVTAAIFG